MKRFILAILFVLFVSPLHAATLSIGTAQRDITPPKSVPLRGGGFRLSQGVETPLTANVVAIESSDNGKSFDQVVFVSVDLIAVSTDIYVAVKEKVAKCDSSVIPEKIVINATHTHTAPTINLTYPKLPVSDSIMDYPEIIDFIAERITDAIAAAWKNRKPGKMAFGLDFGVVGFSRRATYADGSSAMYGNPNQPNFRGYEAMEDHDIGSIFFLDENDKLLGVAVNVACPSQVVEGHHKINADFWHPVRETLKKRFGDNLVVLGWCGAAGDNSPHVQYRKAAVERMNSLRKLDELSEIARKIDRAVADTWDAVRTTASSDVPLIHRVETLPLPMRRVTEEEYVYAKSVCDKGEAAVKENPSKAPAEVAWGPPIWHADVVMLNTRACLG